MRVLADLALARGASLEDVVFASAVGLVVFGGLVVAGALHLGGRLPILDRLARLAERSLGLPAWAAVPFAVAAPSLVSATFGFYWDVSWHIDRGRDPGPFANPAHWFIFIGLAGIAIAGGLSVLFGSKHPPVRAVRMGSRITAPVGGVLLLVTSGIALLGFPLDDVWHRLFGQDVTLWGPTHIQMVAGASLATLALLVLEREARRVPGWSERRTRLFRLPFAAAGAAFLGGLSSLQAEFDFGVPQFRHLYHPVLIMLAAGIGLVAVRIRGGRGSAIGAAVGFLAMRAVLAGSISPGLGRSLLHFPLYLPEAILVELAALRVGTDRPLRLALISGSLIGTFGLAAEWGWSHLWMPLPWHLPLLPKAAPLGFAAAVAGAVIGALIGGALAEGPVRRAQIPLAAVVAAWGVALFSLAYPLPMTARPSETATVSLRTVRSFPNRWVVATVELDPKDAAVSSNWFDVTAWQGAGSGDGGLVISPMRRLEAGLYRTEAAVPIDGRWKTILRLQVGDAVEAAPIYMPLDRAIPAPLIPASAHFTRQFEADKHVLQREAVGGTIWLQRGAYAVLGLIGVAWLAAFGWGLRRLRSTGDFSQWVTHRSSRRRTAASI